MELKLETVGLCKKPAREKVSVSASLSVLIPSTFIAMTREIINQDL